MSSDAQNLIKVKFTSCRVKFWSRNWDFFELGGNSQHPAAEESCCAEISLYKHFAIPHAFSGASDWFFCSSNLPQ